MKTQTTTEQLRDESYHLLMDKDTRQKKVLKAIRKYGPISNRELSKKLDLPINSITGRVKELREMGLVHVEGIKYDKKTDRNVTVFSIHPDINL